MTKIGLTLLLTFITLFAVMSPGQAQTPQAILNQYISDLQRDPNNYALREKIIKFVQTMHPVPAVPEAAERSMARGKVAFETAKSADDFKDAITEFQKAADLAPWLANAYYNLGIALENAENLRYAIENFKLYLVAAPSAKDAQAVKSRIYGIEYKIEQKQKSVSATSQCDHYNVAGRLEEALGACKEAIRLDPKNAMAHYNLGVVLRMRYGSEDAAVARGCPDAMPEFQEAIRLGYGLNAYTLLGTCYNYLKDYMKAKSVIEDGMKHWGSSILSGDQSMMYAHCHLANAYYKLGEREKALLNYEKAKEFGMVDPLLDNKINELRRALGR